MMSRSVGKTVTFRVPPEVYALLSEKIRKHRKYGVYYVRETFYRIFMTGLEALGSDGVDRLIVDIKSKKERRWEEVKRRKRMGGGGGDDHDD
jgi:hypothetical protein